MKIPREERYQVDFPISLTVQTGSVSRRIQARCIGLSRSGAQVETQDRFEKGTTVLVLSEHFGRMGLASVRYCTRFTMKYKLGLSFGNGLRLSDPQRREILEKLIVKPG